MQSNSVKDSSIQTMHSIEFKFGMYIIGHHRTKATDFGEFLMHFFFFKQEVKKEFLHITAYGV